MNRKVTITGRMVGILIALAFVWGCGEQPEPGRKPKVVRKKIVATAKSPAPSRKRPSTPASGKASALKPRSGIARAKPPRTGPAAQSASSSGAAAVSQKGLRPKSEIARQPVPSQPPETAAQKPRLPKSQPSDTAALPAAGSLKTTGRPKPAPSEGKPGAVAAARIEDLQTKPAATKKPAARTKKPRSPYNPQGKTDPFKPLFRDKPEMPKPKSRPTRIPRTPLERVALSQLKLTAVILAPSGNLALVQESTGKGYVIRNGTYIGRNAGKVVEIQKDRVIIEEEVENIVGKLTKRKQQLKLPKPAGGR